MLILIRILVAVYYVAINVYAFLLMKTQKQAEEQGVCSSVRDGSVFVSSILGGAIGVYAAMFVYKYRLRSLPLMVFTPVIAVMHVYLVVVGFLSDFWIIAP